MVQPTEQQLKDFKKEDNRQHFLSILGSLFDMTALVREQAILKKYEDLINEEIKKTLLDNLNNIDYLQGLLEN